MRWGQGHCAALPRGLWDRGRELWGFSVLALPGERCSSVLRLASIDESESESLLRHHRDRLLLPGVRECSRTHFREKIGKLAVIVVDSLPAVLQRDQPPSRPLPRRFCREDHRAARQRPPCCWEWLASTRRALKSGHVDVELDLREVRRFYCVEHKRLHLIEVQLNNRHHVLACLPRKTHVLTRT